MLSKKDKERIAFEELYRREIRHLLDEERGENAAIRFCNSPFGLWLLGAIVLGLFPFVWAQCQEYSQEKVHTRRVVSEIRFRAIKAKQEAENIVTFKKNLEAHTIPSILNGTNGYAEFAGWPMETLVLELRQTGKVADVEVGKKIDVAIHKIFVELAEKGASQVVRSEIDAIIKYCEPAQDRFIGSSILPVCVFLVLSAVLFLKFWFRKVPKIMQFS